jgi:polyhydroxyalkanoate synthase
MEPWFMNRENQAEILQYIDKFSSVFNDMMREVMKRILNNPDEAVATPANGDQDGAQKARTAIKIDPQVFMRQQTEFMQKQQALLQSAARAMLGEPMDSIVREAADDHRFKDKDWSGNPLFSYVKQAYLLNAEYLTRLVGSFEFEDKGTADKLRFFTRQFVNSMAPGNYVLTNPEVCREILDSQGDNLARGIDNFMRDLENSPADAFKITQVAADAFRLGDDLATTPGKIVFRNELMELIQYTPSTEAVFETPLLIIPPFINKYYILDLNEKKSLVKWLVDQGHSVFMISWANPDTSLRHIQFEDYVHKGVVAALNIVEACSGMHKINVAGYCVGGTLLAVSQAYLLARKDERIQSLSFLTTLLDFSEPGEVGSYISEYSYPLLEKNVKRQGYLDGRVLALSFSLLRENNLFWSFFIDNYLKGKDPIPFDILYWNSDSTNIPGPTYLYYLRNMYMGNRLIEPGRLEIDGVAIDLRSMTTPTYYLAALADHIVLWSGAYKSALALGGDLRFVLTESGHVAGVVNPPESAKYSHWVNDSLPGQTQDWLAGAHQKPGSWWDDWNNWLSVRAGAKRKARKPGCKSCPPIEDAPGTYVKVRLEALRHASQEVA